MSEGKKHAVIIYTNEVIIQSQIKNLVQTELNHGEYYDLYKKTDFVFGLSGLASMVNQYDYTYNARLY